MLNLKLQKIMIFMVDVSLGNYATTKGRHNIHIKTNYPSLIQFFKFKEKNYWIHHNGLHGIYLKQQSESNLGNFDREWKVKIR